MRTPFIEDDLSMLRRHYDVDAFIGSGVASALAVFRRAIAADVSISWFASVYTFFMVVAARMQHRPTVILLGGVDTARDDRIGYGIWRSAWRRPLLRWTLRHATRIYAVDASLATALAASSGISDLDVRVLPTGYDSDFWTPGDDERRGVLLVAGCRTRDRFLVKGVDVYIEAARRMSDVPFVLIGTSSDLLAHVATPANLTIIPSIERPFLREHYRRAAVYCQPSRHEGLPNSLCEAMLCGCIPVGARAGGVADAIGDCGIVVMPGDVDALASAILSALSKSASDTSASSRACSRARIIERYPADRREKKLIEAIDEMLDA
ncbi:MAG: glycosyltransferase family 4 protein [bacterium]|nr:glycosyltransferase family 4 protein [Candidatus Kapabacteria bacterium]